MTVEIVPFQRGFAGQAAALLAETHTPSGAGASAGGWDVADVGVARRLVARWQGSGPAVAAVRDGVVVGFMAATLPTLPGDQSARVRLHQHACAGPDRRMTYRRLYAALSGRLARVGAFQHSLAVSAHDQDTLACFFELGFGVDQIRGFRPVPRPGTPAREARGIRLRTARADDLPQMLDLSVELTRFHARPPMLRPALDDLRAIRNGFLAAFDDDRQVLLVAEEQGRLLGLMQAHPDGSHLGAARIGLAVVAASSRSAGVGTALLSGVGAWAAGRGFDLYGAEWSSANLVSDAFWRGRGMVPALFKLSRLIDSRVAWADAGFDHRHLLPESFETGGPPGAQPPAPKTERSRPPP
ncbi:GNAT family N-acetyltransferase [Nonomuraea roseoviolacea]|uniref:GNAT family N-acetyltransferase n=1 Tax=Nonomuraea roseoviolacea TaxID=103837 RepID=UPI0031EE6502